LKKVKNDLEMVLATVQLKNKQLEEDLGREQQWHEEQEQILHSLTEIEEGTKNQIEQIHRRSWSVDADIFCELKNKMLEIKKYREELSNALGEFLEEHFPLPEEGRSSKKKKSSQKPDVELITLNEILELLINKLVGMPHEPYITLSDSFWPPYVELLLRYGVAVRHPEDPNRVRLEAFHV
ncbi:CENPK protein, partial [Crotophaga sulcirostris]|nr:CENPK protein [Crotophaga sulcirostris]